LPGACAPGRQADLLNRMVVANRVVDRERISGMLPQPYEVAVVCEAVDGLIRRTWTLLSAGHRSGGDAPCNGSSDRASVLVS